MEVNLVKWVNILHVVKHDKKMLHAFLKFYEKLKIAKWTRPNDIKKTFNSVDIITCKQSNRLVFNVGGNKYRLITGYYFGHKVINLYVKFVGTHSQYDSIDPCTVNRFNK